MLWVSADCNVIHWSILKGFTAQVVCTLSSKVIYVYQLALLNWILIISKLIVIISQQHKLSDTLNSTTRKKFEWQ